MISIISLLIILTFSILITRIATVALVHTGLSKETSRFQARSAFLGVGFTTSESESLVAHPVRRRILLILMLLGNAGIITAISSLILTFINPKVGASITLKIGVLLGGLVALWILGTSAWVDKWLSRLISWALNTYTRLEAKDFAGLLNLSGEYRITEQKVKSDGWMADKLLKDVRLRDEGILVLGITRKNGKYIGAPNGETRLLPDDNLVLYGRSSCLERINKRHKGASGDIEHQEAISEQAGVVEKEKEKDVPEGKENDGKNEVDMKGEWE
jgi:hypothetical protein